MATIVTDNVEKPILDDRSYRFLLLPNQLEVLVVHDPSTDTSSAALDVDVGSLSDPDDMQGMAHAVEHSVFLGTEKYPAKNDFTEYITRNSGSRNAYTGPTSTNYYFEVSAKPTEDMGEAPLYGALERFAQMFMKPLFLEDSVKSELKVVDEEHKSYLRSDIWRLSQLERSVSNPDHPYHRFVVGNLETLRDEPEKRGIHIGKTFQKFFEEHYSANRMKLVVLGREPLDKLQNWVEEIFCDVHNKNLPQNRWDHIPLMTDNDLLTQVFAKPVTDIRTLSVQFPYQDEDELYESCPGLYLSHLIGHEGPGSILAYIKAKGWATELSAGVSHLCRGSARYEISISLTDEGLKGYVEIVKVLFQYIALIRETGPQRWIADEIKLMSEVNFRFQEKSSALKDFTSKLSAAMQTPIKQEWLLDDRLREYDAEAIKTALTHLRPDNFKMFIYSQTFPFELSERERWYGTEYKVEKIPGNHLEAIKKAAGGGSESRSVELHLPQKNEFIPTKLDMVKVEAHECMKHPVLLEDKCCIRLWWKKDDQFWVPKANVNLTLENPFASATPKGSVIAKLYCKLVEDSLMEYLYNPSLAGLYCSIRNDSDSIVVKLHGYHEKMSIFLERILVSMRDLKATNGRFNIMKDSLMKELKGLEYQNPWQQMDRFTRLLNSEKGWTVDEEASELPDTTVDDTVCFFSQLLSQTRIDILVHGNMSKDDALQMGQLVMAVLNPRSLPQSQCQRSLMFPEGGSYTYSRRLKDPDNMNTGVEYFLYVSEKTNEWLRAKLQLFQQMVRGQVFHRLRTEEQLCYLVSSDALTTSTTMGYRIRIQSSDQTAEFLEERIDTLLVNLGKKLWEMPRDEFESHKQSLVNALLKDSKNLSQETALFWAEIKGRTLNFEQG